MTDAARELSRLVGTLEDFCGQETVLFRAADYDGIRAVQERAAPVVSRVAALAPAGEAAIHERVARLIERRAELILEMKAASGRTGRELAEVSEGVRQCARVAPAYAARNTPRKRLSVAM